MPTLEDKIVQRAVAEILAEIWEAEYLGFSYGFRRERKAHDALDALMVGIHRKKVNWVLDADIRGYFDNISHEWMVRFIEHRIGDKRIVRLIESWMEAGVLEEGELKASKIGSPQGGIVSPVLANIYLHYVFDFWAHDWRKRKARGDVIIVRYADDFVVGFQYREEAEQFQRELVERLAKFELELQSEKTRLIEFGRYAEADRAKRGEGKPETFDFLGFTHICGKNSKGAFLVKRQTIRKRMRTKLAEIKEEMKRRLHDPIPEVGAWLKSVLEGHYNYYGVPHNLQALDELRREVMRLWRKMLARRSQKGRVTWKRVYRLAKKWLPLPRLNHPYPWQRLVVTT